MKVGINLKIDVSKIAKSKLFKGDKGVYLDATVFIDTVNADQYGNHGMITQGVTKEEKAANVLGAILGNGKIFWRDNATDSQGNRHQQQSNQPQQQQGQGFDELIDDIPFN